MRSDWCEQHCPFATCSSSRFFRLEWDSTCCLLEATIATSSTCRMWIVALVLTIQSDASLNMLNRGRGYEREWILCRQASQRGIVGIQPPVHWTVSNADHSHNAITWDYSSGNIHAVVQPVTLTFPFRALICLKVAQPKARIRLSARGVKVLFAMMSNFVYHGLCCDVVLATRLVGQWKLVR